MPRQPDLTPTTKQILIESILGGQSKYVNYATKDQFLHSYNIDPDITSAFNQSDGTITPTGLSSIGTPKGTPMWIITQPKSDKLFCYDAAGSIVAGYTDAFSQADAAATDLNDAGTAAGNGGEYYDNYIYAARSTTVARYGPLDGSPTWADDYWVGTLGKLALNDTTYPSAGYTSNSVKMPNHAMHRHSDGRLYFCDVTNNQGIVHYIRTTKTTAEGDTNNGSTYGALTFGYGQWPTDIESYGSDLAIAILEGNDIISTADQSSQKRAKLSFWDTTSTNYNKITDVEFPDPIIFALLNTNGVLYTFSGQAFKQGVRICRFTGGYTFEQVAFLDYAYPPLAGAVDGYLNRILFGGHTIEPNCLDGANQIPNNSFMRGAVFSIGSKKSPINSDVFQIMGSSSTAAATAITALKLAGQSGLDLIKPVTGWGNGATYGLDSTVRVTRSLFGTASQNLRATYGPPSAWRSQVYRIGRRFKVTRISIPLTQPMDTASSGLTIGIRRDSFDSTKDYIRVGDFNGAAFDNASQRLVIRPDALVCQHRCLLEMVFTGPDTNNPYPRVGFPIEIDLEIYNDD